MGHSFIYRLESFQFQNRRFGWYNLGFDGTEIQVQFAGLGGETLRPGPKFIQSKRLIHTSFFIHINHIQFFFRLVEMICVEKKIRKN